MNDWNAGLEEEETEAVVRTVARQLKLWREAAGMTQAEFGAAIGYGEELISSVERGRRIPRPEFLDRADEVLGADGKVAAMKRDVGEARYPRKVRDLKRLEADTVEICAYNNAVIEGLCQTEEYTRAVLAARWPPLSEDELEERVCGRLARQSIINASTARPVFSFVQCESTLRRRYGSSAVMRAQLERLLEIGNLRNVDLRVIPLSQEGNAGADGPFRLLRLKDGTTVGYNAVQLISRVLTDPKMAQVLDIRYGMLRAQALPSQESLAFIKKALEET